MCAPLLLGWRVALPCPFLPMQDLAPEVHNHLGLLSKHISTVAADILQRTKTEMLRELMQRFNMCVAPLSGVLGG